MFPHVVIAIDFSPAWPLLEQRLIRLRAKGVKRVSLVHIISPKSLPSATESDIQALQDRLQQQAEPLTELGLDTACYVDTGKPSEQLAAYADKLAADLILIGCQGHGRWQEMLLGSTALNLAHLTRIPLWLEPVAQGEHGDAYNTIVLATDMSPTASKAERLFQTLAPHYQHRVAIIAEQLLEADGYSIEAAQLHLTALAKRIPKLDAIVVPGEFKQVIIHEANAWQADVIIIGQQGHSRLHERLLGSTAQTLLEGAACPVILVPSTPQES
ncbi:MAG: UspA domain-containing protein [Halomonas sp. 54_146]|nr:MULTISPECIES: universal stress protein [unclassified Halomonas]KUJ87167.1 MAG: UspA domain-containing protein [Halomonas sp. 54_146]HAA44389.1 hypothetical protein [Halomonas sp.]